MTTRPLPPADPESSADGGTLEQAGTTFAPSEVEGSTAHFQLGALTLSVGIHGAVVRIRFGRDRPRRRPWSLVPPVEELGGGHVTVSAPSEREVQIATSSTSVSIRKQNDGMVHVRSADGAIDGGPDIRRSLLRWTNAMPTGASYYGLGERTGLLDKRGRRYTCWTTDRYEEQGPGSDTLYKAIPFMLTVDRCGTSHGLFLNTTWRSTFDLTGLHDERYTLETAGPELDLFVIPGPEPADVLEKYTRLTGRLTMPPRWALGYHQSRWSYGSDSDVREVAAQLRSRHIPADSIGLDIAHMDGCRAFTWDPLAFAAPDALLRDLREHGFECVAIVNCGVKVEPGYRVYDEGAARGYFVKLPDGTPFSGYVWPGRCVFPDFAQPAVQRWWGQWYSTLLDAGVGGVINDMNEPAVHDLPMDAPESRRIDPPDDAVHGVANDVATHAEVHNVYGLLEARAAQTALRRLRPDRRTLLVSRSGFAGIQSHAVVWTGDNASYWEHLEMSLPQLMNLGVSGVALAGADVGGFFADCGPELLVRWMQLGAFYPLMRSNNASGCADQEPWVWGPLVEARCRRAIELRYRLLPYLYTCVAESHRTGAPILRPLWWHDPDDAEARQREDEALLGPDLLVAPILRPGRTHREVYLPAGRWYEWRTDAVHIGPTHVLVRATLDDDPPVFGRGGAIVPIGPVLQWTDERPTDHLTLEVYPDAAGAADGMLYEDDGRTYGYERGEWAITTFRWDGSTLVTTPSGAWAPPERTFDVRVHDAGTPDDEP